MVYVFAWFVAISAVSARLTPGTNPAVRSEFEDSFVGAALHALSGFFMIAGLVWGFLFLNWQTVLIYFLVGIVAGGFASEIFRRISRALFGMLADLFVISTVCLMYADYFGWIEL